MGTSQEKSVLCSPENTHDLKERIMNEVDLLKENQDLLKRKMDANLKRKLAAYIRNKNRLCIHIK